ncbi:hypothetical protein [Aeromicrobium sp.]|uniref:hypothetical protein n=1 Tax=Aeromicrobium sp. TaxID=1871063 RepID=UPI0019A11271|nr:hypothetical protein [Aeromicrobium sp.]MBC7629985.1 hypothetical protein [Aeromicrobium sp.]
MTDRDDFDKIVEGLDLDFTFPDEPADPEEPAAPPSAAAWSPEQARSGGDIEEPFYRKVDSTPIIPRRRGILLAWLGLLGAPLSLVVATISGVYLDPSVIGGAALIFVAAAIFLILQLPEHGPSRRDWPDDGAVL